MIVCVPVGDGADGAKSGHVGCIPVPLMRGRSHGDAIVYQTDGECEWSLTTTCQQATVGTSEVFQTRPTARLGRKQGTKVWHGPLLTVVSDREIAILAVMDEV